MNLLNRRYFLLISIVILISLAISLQGNALIFLSISLVILALIYLYLIKRRRGNGTLRIIILVLACASILGSIRGGALIARNDYLENEYSGIHKITGYVVECSSSNAYSSESIIAIESLDGERVSFDAVLVTSFNAELGDGDFFECSVQIMPIAEYENSDYLKNKNEFDYPLICSVLSEENMVHMDREWRARIFLTDLNQTLSANLKATLGTKNGSLASALLLGNRELIGDSTLRDFKHAGVYHMLALSGMHVAILVGLFDVLLKKLKAQRGLRIAVLSFFSLFYIALTGFQLSACRAMFMLWMVYLSLTVRARSDTLTSLFASLTIICIISPASVFDVGLMLSFLSTLGVICASIVKNKLFARHKANKANGFLKNALLIAKKVALLSVDSIFVFVLTLPVIMIYFGEVSLATFVSNLFMGVLCEAFMVLSLAVMLLPLGTAISNALSLLSGAVGNVMSACVEKIANIDDVMLSLEYPNTDIIVWGLFLCFVLLLVINLNRKWLIFVPAIAFSLVFAVNVAIYNASILNMVQAEFYIGDEIVLSSSDGVYICDVSSGSYRDLYNGAMLAKRSCHTEIDGVILSHYDSDFAVSLKRIANTFKLHSLYLPRPQNQKESDRLNSIYIALENTGVKIYVFDANEPLYLLGGKLVLSDREYISGRVNPSLALTYSYGDSRITLLKPPYFNSYLDESGAFDDYISKSDYLIFGSDGNLPDGKFDIFYKLKDGAEVTFCDDSLLLNSDFEPYLYDFEIYVNAEYKKYDLK